MLSTLVSSTVQQFIRDHEREDERILVLKHKKLFDLPAAIIANQIACRRKAKGKLPTWYSTPGIIYPPAVNLEQSSSEVTARYKAEMLTKQLSIRGDEMAADLTGGFGVDSFFLSRLVKHFHYVEPNQELLELTQHNHQCLGSSKISYHHLSAREFLGSTNQPYAFFYIDPSRRSSANKKVFRLTECEPNVLLLLPQLFERSRAVLLKTSPLLDIHRGLRDLQKVSDVFVISVDNECKEILFLCRSGFSGEAVIHAVNLTKTEEEFQFTFTEERTTASVFSEPLAYLYEPNASILKAGAFKRIAFVFQLAKLSPNTHLYTSGRLHSNFPGRIFEIKSLLKPKEVIDAFPSRKANVITRNYPLTAEGLRKKLRLTDGGEVYLLAFSGQTKKYLIAATRLK